MTTIWSIVQISGLENGHSQQLNLGYIGKNNQNSEVGLRSPPLHTRCPKAGFLHLKEKERTEGTNWRETP